MKKAVVIFSGGQDSTTCLLQAIKDYDEVVALSFLYGQKNKVELDCAKNICSELNVEHIILDVSFIAQISDTPYVTDGKIGGKSSLDENLPSTWVPNRNMLFITITHSLATKIGAEAVVTGVNAIDYSGYPDCRPIFIDSLHKTLSFSVPVSKVRILTPLIYKSKSDIWNEAEKLGKLDFIIEKTHTCYNGDHEHLHPWGYGCGECDSCKIRKESFEKFIKAKPQ